MQLCKTLKRTLKIQNKISLPKTIHEDDKTMSNLLFRNLILERC